jgi:hypothetical protein
MPIHDCELGPEFDPSVDLPLVYLSRDLPFVRTNNAAEKVGKAERSTKFQAAIVQSGILLTAENALFLGVSRRSTQYNLLKKVVKGTDVGVRGM